ncbi:tryptophan 7-halogenase [Alteromonas gilva]|uniref:Tryptophan 7-halogenase n=1 Tax=Alteromonas gilva TaxID=2987522 RepID=A0ABT5KYE4_9ALTE|nr:tryptophan 7-halogenase [Alteromonas gilva]MDC8829799.1 tryptophan 7-halogenase [Alteromonas gilva]
MTIRHVGIYGHGLALQVSAALLHCHLRDSGVQVHAFNTQADSSVTVCEWDDTLLKLCQQLKSSPLEWLSRCNGGFSWGVHCDWLADDGFIGAALWGLNANQHEFEHGVLRLKAQQPARPVSDFSIAGQAARLGHFNLASRQQQQWADSMKFTVQCDASKLCELLTNYNKAQGVNQHNAADIELSSLRQSDSAPTIDLWINLTDSSAPPRQVTPASFTATPPQPVTTLLMHEEALEKRLWLGHHEFRYRLNSMPLSRLSATWQHNTVTIDLPALTAVVPPTTFLVASLEQLLQQWPAQAAAPANAAAYNTHMQRYSDELGTFNQALMPGNPPVMAEQLFADCARLPVMETDAVSRWQWFCLLCGKGIVPASTSIALANDPDSTILPLVEKVTAHINSTAKAMPAYSSFLQQFARAANTVGQ